ATEDQAFASGAHHDAIAGVLEVDALDLLAAAPHREQRGLVDQVGQICATHTGCGLDITSRSTSDPIRLSRLWTLRIANLSSFSGSGTTMVRSNRPGRSSAGSRMSGRLVAA